MSILDQLKEMPQNLHEGGFEFQVLSEPATEFQTLLLAGSVTPDKVTTQTQLKSVVELDVFFAFWSKPSRSIFGGPLRGSFSPWIIARLKKGHSLLYAASSEDIFSWRREPVELLTCKRWRNKNPVGLRRLDPLEELCPEDQHHHEVIVVLFDDGTSEVVVRPLLRDDREQSPTRRAFEKLDELMEPGEEWKTFHGFLWSASDHQDPPDHIAATLASRYGLTSKGRTFRITKRNEPTLSGPYARGDRLNLRIDGTRWQPSVSVLLDRMFPEFDARWGEDPPKDYDDLATQGSIDIMQRRGWY